MKKNERFLPTLLTIPVFYIEDENGEIIIDTDEILNYFKTKMGELLIQHSREGREKKLNNNTLKTKTNENKNK